MAMTKGGSVPNAGSPGADYPAPTPHAAVVAHQVYEAPTSGAGIGAGVDGADTIDAMTGSNPAMDNQRLGGGSAKAIEQPVMGDDSETVFGAEYEPASPSFGGGTVKALEEMEGLQPGTGYGSVTEPVAKSEVGLSPGATGYGSATGTGNQPAGIDRRVVGGEAKTDGGWKSL
jgi:hypothetical protein